MADIKCFRIVLTLDIIVMFQTTGMKKYLLPILAAGAILACGTHTKIESSWRDPNTVINTNTKNKFIVAALLKNETVRRRTEDLMAFYYPGKAVSSYKKLGTEGLKQNQEYYDQMLKNENFDAVVVMRLVKAGTTKQYRPGNGEDYYNSWVDFYNHAWPTYYDPGDYTIKKKYFIEVNVYSLVRNKLVWSGTTSTINPSGSDELFDDVINTVNERMKKEGFLQ
jgi:hypothetical protein